MFIPESEHENLSDYGTFPYINIYIKQEFEKSFKIVMHNSLIRISPEWTPLEALLPFALDKFRVASSACIIIPPRTIKT